MKSLLLLLIGIRTEADRYYLFIGEHTPVGPYIRYTTVDNQVIDKKVIFGTEDEEENKPVNPARKKVTILYFAAWPQVYVERNFARLLGEPLGFLAFGCLLLWCVLRTSG